MRTVSLTASREAASGGVQRLQAQRQATAAARAHANALQLKVVVGIGCALSVVLGYSLHRTSMSVANVERAPLVATASSAGGGLPDVHIGQVQVPYEGDTCRRFRFDNRSGAVMGESFASCATAELATVAATPLPTRAEAIMSAFRVPR
jgi:hypothetical protein